MSHGFRVSGSGFSVRVCHEGLRKTRAWETCRNGYLGTTRGSYHQASDTGVAFGVWLKAFLTVEGQGIATAMVWGCSKLRSRWWGRGGSELCKLRLQ